MRKKLLNTNAAVRNENYSRTRFASPRTSAC